MTVNSFGDLATNTLLRNHNARLKADMDRLVSELGSGQVAIRDTSLGGSYRAISGIQSSLERLDAYDLASTEAEGFVDAVQTALEAIQKSSGALSITLLTASEAGTAAHANAVSGSAKQDFEAAIDRLNGNYAGRSLFGGQATDRPPVAASADILAALESEISASGASSAEDIATVISDWFAVGGGFDTQGYLGSSETLAPMTVGSGRSVSLKITAQDQEFRDTLAGMAMAVMITSPAISASPEQQNELASIAGNKLINANQDLIVTRAAIGTHQQAIENAKVEAKSERSAMDMALSKIVEADPYERAVRLKEVETQIEMFYSLTARTSSLNLMNYLR